MQARDNFDATAISIRHSPDVSPVCEPRERVAERSRREQRRSATPRCYKMRREFHLDKCHVTPYTLSVIKTFADKETQRIYRTGESKRLPVDLVRRAIRRLDYIDLANTLNDLRVSPGVLSQKYLTILPQIHPVSQRCHRSPTVPGRLRSGALRAGRLCGRILATYFRDRTLQPPAPVEEGT